MPADDLAPLRADLRRMRHQNVRAWNWVGIVAGGVLAVFCIGLLAWALTSGVLA